MNTPDYSALARQFMQMWQQQMNSAFTDPNMVDAMFQAMRQPERANNGRKPDPHASTARDEQLDELTQRIRSLEKRVSELEAAAQSPAPSKSKPKGKKKSIGKRAVKPSDKKAAAKRPAGSAGSTKKPARSAASKRKPRKSK